MNEAMIEPGPTERQLLNAAGSDSSTGKAGSSR
jgi:hypothetical protein